MDPKRRQQRQEKRQREIVEAALDMIVDGGLNVVTTATLASKLDVTPGALYRYFGSKDEILVAVEILVLQRLSTAIEAALPVICELEPIEQLVSLVEAYRLLQVHRPGEFKVLSYFVGVPDAVINDDVAQRVVEPAIRLLGTFSQTLEAAAEANALSPGDALDRAVVMWSCVHGILARRKIARMAPIAFNIERLYQATVTTLLQGWGADPKLIELAWSERARMIEPKLVATVGGL